MAGFDVVPEPLRDGGTRLAEAGDRFADAVETLEATLAGYGEPWGSGDLASLIGPAYRQTAEYIIGCLYVAADEMAIGGDDLVGMADAYEAVEDEVAQMFTSISGQLG
ncbi:hypothetical protein ACGFH8_30970 [Micromonospora sp. NPDC049175]|uniref:hypothetical protein n=1 Tax=Micromonospora sp. NPDC049175 TaxID=3364266 RepID=UPI0037117DCC